MSQPPRIPDKSKYSDLFADAAKQTNKNFNHPPVSTNNLPFKKVQAPARSQNTQSSGPSQGAVSVAKTVSPSGSRSSVVSPDAEILGGGELAQLRVFTDPFAATNLINRQTEVAAKIGKDGVSMTPNLPSEFSHDTSASREGSLKEEAELDADAEEVSSKRQYYDGSGTDSDRGSVQSYPRRETKQIKKKTSGATRHPVLSGPERVILPVFVMQTRDYHGLNSTADNGWVFKHLNDYAAYLTAIDVPFDKKALEPIAVSSVHRENIITGESCYDYPVAVEEEKESASTGALDFVTFLGGAK